MLPSKVIRMFHAARFLTKYSAGFLLMSSVAFSQGAEARAEALIQHAQELSDIRSPKAPAFRLKATFSFIGKGLEKAEGTYTETWVSRSQWRRETAVSGLLRTEVGRSESTFWQLDNREEFPETAGRVADLLRIFPLSTERLAFESIADPAPMDPSAECAITKRDPRNDTKAFCFHKNSGLLLEKDVPEVRPANVVAYSCRYEHFEKFVDRWFPRALACFVDGHLKLSAKVLELESVQPADPSVFAAPADAIELGACNSVVTPARLESRPRPSALLSDNYRGSVARISAIVDVKGHPQRLKVTRSAGKAFDEEALKAVRSWQFEPAKCGGESVPMQMNIEVSSGRPLRR